MQLPILQHCETDFFNLPKYSEILGRTGDIVAAAAPTELRQERSRQALLSEFYRNQDEPPDLTLDSFRLDSTLSEFSIFDLNKFPKPGDIDYSTFGAVQVKKIAEMIGFPTDDIPELCQKWQHLVHTIINDDYMELCNFQRSQAHNI